MSKRLFDLFFSALGLILLSPVLLFASILIFFEDRGPIFFRQVRIGRFEHPFKILKFRTMSVDAETLGPQITIGDRDPRVTRVGHFLRQKKIDELPQLINVFLGEMSLVGPRPEVPRYVALYNQKQRAIFQMRPGITDLASISFRHESEILKQFNDPEKAYIENIMPQKLALNLEYLHTQSMIKDIFLILKTLKIL